MCNQHRLKSAVAEIADTFRDLGKPLSYPEGAPNLEPREVIAITDTGPIVRAGPEGAGGLELVQRPWSWKGPTGAPVFNFRSEGRRFSQASRCLIPTDGFYEFTAPEDPKQKKKDRWLFTMRGEGVFFIAGVMRGPAWAMLTCEPGPDMAPFHARQVVVLGRRDAVAWLGGGAEADLLRPAEAGTLAAERVG
jgi:putative SOS response-associated peptidase YedK